MPRSFSVRLSDYVIARPIGLDKKLLYRTVDATDIHTILSDEGFVNFGERRAVHSIHGHDLSSLRERIVGQLLGVPRDAYVEIDAYGKHSDFLVIKLEY